MAVGPPECKQPVHGKALSVGLSPTMKSRDITSQNIKKIKQLCDVNMLL